MLLTPSLNASTSIRVMPNRIAKEITPFQNNLLQSRLIIVSDVNEVIALLEARQYLLKLSNIAIKMFDEH